MPAPFFLAALAALPLSGDPPCCTPAKDPGYVLHEWGTFTTIAGSDGIVLDGLAYDDHPLPEFVHRRARYPAGFAGVRCKMETPVIYFYSERARELTVRVGFLPGVLTQWYPEVRDLVPAAGASAELRGGVLDWGRIRVLAPGEGLGELPAVGALPWGHAREVDANVIARDEPINERERFLFYRGLGSFALPVSARSNGLGTLELANNGTETLAGAIVLERNGRSLRAQRLEPLAPGARTSVMPGGLPAIDLRALMALTARMLVEQGLFEREAEAMVNTWQESYFETDGLRVLQPLPRSLVDWVLPLQASPPPRESARVFIARLDLLSPAAEQAALTALPRIRTAEEARERLGRFALPVLRRLATLASDDRERAHALELAGLMEASF